MKKLILAIGLLISHYSSSMEITNEITKNLAVKQELTFDIELFTKVIKSKNCFAASEADEIFQKGLSILLEPSQEEIEVRNKIATTAFGLSCAVYNHIHSIYICSDKTELEKSIKNKVTEIVRYDNKLKKNNSPFTHYINSYLNCCSSLTGIIHPSLSRRQIVQNLRAMTSELEKYSAVIEAESAANAHAIQNIQQ